ncbi:hypothetical protein [Streptomyces uncialis]|uniref:hypothetical protein n=1 Tax=Streptomyces uncialis TaxID=1048205 RepID=UPI00386D736D|nr:hypothetical protein OG924_00010 [Streptomyces uncialis]WTE15357.1 hypothetical protein OG924_36990 [Streptomyces uncialis]
MIWSSDDVARDSVRRTAAGLTPAGVDEAVAEAATRERETQEALRSPSGREPEPYEWDLEVLAERWAAKHVEWRRIQALMNASGWAAYDPSKDTQGSAWAQEREARRAGFLEQQAAHWQQRQDAKDELQTEVWLTAPAGRRIRALAARARLSPDQIVAQLAEHAVIGEDGTVSVPAFTPS